jgi:hypothetical protein
LARRLRGLPDMQEQHIAPLVVVLVVEVDAGDRDHHDVIRGSPSTAAASVRRPILSQSDLGLILSELCFYPEMPAPFPYQKSRFAMSTTDELLAYAEPYPKPRFAVSISR